MNIYPTAVSVVCCCDNRPIMCFGNIVVSMDLLKSVYFNGSWSYCVTWRRGRGAMARTSDMRPGLNPLFPCGVSRETPLFLPSQCDWVITLMAASSS